MDVPNLILIETITGNKYPVQVKGDPEGTACIAARDLKQPCRVVKQGDTQ